MKSRTSSITTWKNKINEKSFNYIDSTVKEMTAFFGTRVENLEPKEDRKNLPHLPKNTRIRSPPRKEKGKTPTHVS